MPGSTTYPRRRSGAGIEKYLLTVGLDPRSRSALWQTITDLAEQGTTIVQVTHSDTNAAYGRRIVKLRESERISWSGKHRPPLDDKGVYPRPLQNPLPVWIAVGGTPESVIRAGTLGLPLAIAIIGGLPEQFVPLVELYYRAADHAGHDRGGGYSSRRKNCLVLPAQAGAAGARECPA